MITGPWLLAAVATYSVVTGAVVLAGILLVGRRDRSQWRAGYAAGRLAPGKRPPAPTSKEPGRVIGLPGLSWPPSG